MVELDRLAQAVAEIGRMPDVATVLPELNGHLSSTLKESVFELLTIKQADCVDYLSKWGILLPESEANFLINVTKAKVLSSLLGGLTIVMKGATDVIVCQNNAVDIEAYLNFNDCVFVDEPGSWRRCGGQVG